MERPEPSSAAESSLTSWSTSGSPASTATPVSPAFTATPVVSPASTAIPVVLPASTATPVVSLASAATLVVSPASAAISVISPASTATSSASAATPAAQAHPTLPSSSLVYSQVSRIIASRKQRAGIWFPHLGLIEKTPESTTTAMLKQPFLPESKRKMEERLPSRYQLRQQQANKSSFPFSVHDNRRGLEFCGHSLDESLGRKKLEQVQMHFHSTNFNHWTSDYVPTPEDNMSTYQAAYTAKSRARGLFFPLYPKHHSDRWNARFI